MDRSRSIRSLGIICATILLLTATLTQPVAAASVNPLQISAVTVDVTAMSDGSVAVEEHYFVRFNSRQDDFQVLLGKHQGNEMRFDELAVALNPDPAGSYVFTAAEHLGEAATLNTRTVGYRVDPDPLADGSRIVRLLARFEAGSTAVIRYTYHLDQAVSRATSLALLRTSYLSLPHAPAIGAYRLLLQFPALTEAKSVTVIPVTPAESKTEVTADGFVVFDARNLLPNEQVELLVTVPAEVFPEAAVNTDLARITQQMVEAQQQTQSLQKSLQRSRVVPAAVVILFVLGLISALFFYFFYDREGRFRRAAPGYTDWVLRVQPALLAVLLRRDVPARLILSSLTRLVNRGELSQDGYVYTWLNPERNDYSDFLPSEIFLLQWLYGEIAQGSTTISAVQIRNYARNKRTSESFQIFYSEFRGLLNEGMAKESLFHTSKAYFGLRVGLILAGVYVILPLLTIILLRRWLALILLVPAAVFLMLALRSRYLTADGYARAAEVKYFDRDLSEPDRIMERLGDAAELQTIFVLLLPRAVALGRTRKFLEAIERLPKAQGDLLAAALLKTYAADREQTSLQQLAKDLTATENLLASSFYLGNPKYLTGADT